MTNPDPRQVCEYSNQCHNYDPWSEKCNFRRVERFDCYAFQKLSIRSPIESSRLVLEDNKPADLSQVASS